MNETIEDNKTELPPIANLVEDSIASRTKEITKRPKRERSPTIQNPPPAPKIKKVKEVAPKLPDKTKWTMEEQKQFFSALRIYGKNFEALGQFFNTRRRVMNPEAQKRTFGQIRCFYYRSFRTVSKLCTLTEDEKSSIDSFELRSVLAYLCLKPKVKCFDKKPTITVLHQLIRNGSAFLRVKGQREHVSIIGKALKPPKTTNTLGSTKQTDRTLSKHVKILLSPASPNAYMRVALSCRYPHIEILISRTTTIPELIDKLTQYWQLNNHAQTLFKDDLSFEQFILYPHGSYLVSTDSQISSSNEPTSSSSLLDLTSQKQLRSRSDSEHSTEQIITSDCTRKRNHLSESDATNGNETMVNSTNQSISPPSTSTTNLNKSNLARTAMLSAAKRAASGQNPLNYDGTPFTLLDCIEDEADSSASLLRQRFDAIDLTDEFASEEEIEPDANNSAPISTTATSSTTTAAANANNLSITLNDLSQGITRTNPLYSTFTIGELQKLLQRPKEFRLIYDFSNLSRSTTNESSPIAFLHYVIQMANQCLTSIAERQVQIDSKTSKKPITKKQQQTLKSKCYCSCCPYHQQHQINIKDQRRITTKTTISPNTELCAFLQMPQSIPPQDYSNDDLLNVQTVNNNHSDGNSMNKQSQLDEQSDIFDTLPWRNDSIEQTQNPITTTATTTAAAATTTLSIPSTSNTTTELPSLLNLLLPMMNNAETNATVQQTSVPSSASGTTTQLKPSAIVFSSNNGVIDDPLIQSLAAEQAASAHNYDLLSYRHKRVRRPLRYGDQSTRPSNIQLLLDANLNAQQTAATNQRLMFNTTTITSDLPTTSSNNPFRSDCENPNDLLNDNTNMSTVSLSTTIVNAALQSNTSRLRLDWPDNMSDLSFGSFPDLLDSNTTSGELGNFEQSTTTEQNKCASENSISEALFAINNTTNLLLQN